MAMNMKPFTDFVKVLSWQKLVQATLFLLLLILAWGFWENRVTVYNSLRVGARVESDEPLIINLSNGTKSYIDTTLSKSKDLIGGIQIVNVNFKKNSRGSAAFFYNDSVLKSAVEQYQATRIADSPLFTDNEVNNQRLINLINGDFVCYDFKDTPGSKLYPAAGKDIPSVCSISIPPYYGRFSGYMNLYLLRKPLPDDLIFIKQIARDISLRLYESDIDKTNAPVYGKN